MIKTTSLLVAAVLLTPISIPVGAEMSDHWPEWIGRLHWMDGEYIQEHRPQGALEYRRGFYLERSHMLDIQNPGTEYEYGIGAGILLAGGLPGSGK